MICSTHSLKFIIVNSSVLLSIDSSGRQFVRPFVSQPADSPVHSSVRRSIRSLFRQAAVHPFICLLNRSSVRSYVRPSVPHLFAHVSVLPVVPPFVRPSVRPSALPPVIPSYRPSVRSSVRPSVRPSILGSFGLFSDPLFRSSVHLFFHLCNPSIQVDGQMMETSSDSDAEVGQLVHNDATEPSISEHETLVPARRRLSVTFSS